MLRNITNLAEKLATTASESRRGFLCRMGKAALGTVGALAGMFALSSPAEASFCGACTQHSDCGVGFRCCRSNCQNGLKKCLAVATCP